MSDDGVAYVDSDLQWLRYVQATTADHEFTEDWGKRMEEILIPVGSLKIEESSSEGRKCKEGKGEKRKPRVEKPKESNETSPQEQGEASPKPARKNTPSNDKKSRPSLLERASKKLLEEDDHKDVSGHFKTYTMQDRDIFCEKAKRIADIYDDGVYEGLAKVKAIGCVLAQPSDHKLDYPIYFSSRQLNDAERNYTTTEREGLSMVYAVKKFMHIGKQIYVFCRPSSTFVLGE